MPSRYASRMSSPADLLPASARRHFDDLVSAFGLRSTGAGSDVQFFTPEGFALRVASLSTWLGLDALDVGEVATFWTSLASAHLFNLFLY